MFYAVAIIGAFITVILSYLYKGRVAWIGGHAFIVIFLAAPASIAQVGGLIVMAIYWVAAIGWIFLDLIKRSAGGATKVNDR